MKAILEDFRITKEYDVFGRGDERFTFVHSMTVQIEVKVFLEGDDDARVGEKLLRQAEQLGCEE